MSRGSSAGDWIAKARQEARSARRLLMEPPEIEDAAYHVHQAVEKAIKAVLIAQMIRYPRRPGAGHDLEVLSRLIPAADPLYPRARSLADLTPWATAFRYPADDPLTAQPLPTTEEVERRLAEATALVEAVALRIDSGDSDLA